MEKTKKETMCERVYIKNELGKKNNISEVVEVTGYGDYIVRGNIFSNPYKHPSIQNEITSINLLAGETVNTSYAMHVKIEEEIKIINRFSTIYPLTGLIYEVSRIIIKGDNQGGYSSSFNQLYSIVKGQLLGEPYYQLDTYIEKGGIDNIINSLNSNNATDLDKKEIDQLLEIKSKSKTKTMVR